jgi:tripartite-type tricarboxylate transporter receptor subunit TctC
MRLLEKLTLVLLIAVSLPAFGQTGLPRPIVNLLNKTTLAALDDPEVMKRFFAVGLETRTRTPEGFARFIESEMLKWAQVVKATGARIE